jgi:hypothetical protein
MEAFARINKSNSESYQHISKSTYTDSTKKPQENKKQEPAKDDFAQSSRTHYSAYSITGVVKKPENHQNKDDITQTSRTHYSAYSITGVVKKPENHQNKDDITSRSSYPAYSTTGVTKKPENHQNKDDIQQSTRSSYAAPAYSATGVRVRTPRSEVLVTGEDASKLAKANARIHELQETIKV